MDYNAILIKTLVKLKEQDINPDIEKVKNSLDGDGIKTFRLSFTYESATYYLQIAYDEKSNRYDVYVMGMGQSKYIIKTLYNNDLVHELYQEIVRINKNFIFLFYLSKEFRITHKELFFRLDEFEVITFSSKNKIDYISLRSLFDYYGKEYKDIYDNLSPLEEYKYKTINELQQLLDNSLSNEQYELASKIKGEIDKIKIMSKAQMHRNCYY